MIRIRSLSEGFRRSGIAHSVAPTEYPDDRFTADELEQLLFEPKLAVEVLPDDARELTRQDIQQLITDWRDEVGNDDQAAGADLSAQAADTAGKSGETDEAGDSGEAGEDESDAKADKPAKRSAK